MPPSAGAGRAVQLLAVVVERDAILRWEKTAVGEGSLRPGRRGRPVSARCLGDPSLTSDTLITSNCSRCPG